MEEAKKAKQEWQWFNEGQGEEMMDGPKILEVVERYRAHFEECGVSIADFPHKSIPGTVEEKLAHCHGMLAKIEAFVAEERIDKALRWLGFIQGCLWTTGEYSLEELMDHSRPSAESETSI